LPQLATLSDLKPRTVRASLISLIQHNVVWHVENQGEPEMFEVNIDECLMRLRYGRFVHIAEMLFGKAVRAIFTTVVSQP
jgi:DNA-directed RNA polymerase III subunit RPC3